MSAQEILKLSLVQVHTINNKWLRKRISAKYEHNTFHSWESTAAIKGQCIVVHESAEAAGWAWKEGGVHSALCVSYRSTQQRWSHPCFFTSCFSFCSLCFSAFIMAYQDQHGQYPAYGQYPPQQQQQPQQQYMDQEEFNPYNNNNHYQPQQQDYNAYNQQPRYDSYDNSYGGGGGYTDNPSGQPVSKEQQSERSVFEHDDYSSPRPGGPK